MRGAAVGANQLVVPWGALIMETFVLMSFWVLVVGFVSRIFITALSTYPRKAEYSLGFDVAATIFKIPFFLWAAYLLWA